MVQAAFSSGIGLETTAGPINESGTTGLSLQAGFGGHGPRLVARAEAIAVLREAIHSAPMQVAWIPPSRRNT